MPRVGAMIIKEKRLLPAKKRGTTVPIFRTAPQGSCFGSTFFSVCTIFFFSVCTIFSYKTEQPPRQRRREKGLRSFFFSISSGPHPINGRPLTTNSTAITYLCADLVLKCLGMRRDAFPRMFIDWESFTDACPPKHLSQHYTV